MNTEDTTQARVRARDAAMRLLNRLTTGAAVSALVGVGLFGAISAYTAPGSTTKATATASTTGSTPASSSSSTSSSSTSSSSSGLQSSSTPVTSSSSSGVAVSGGS